MTRSAGALPLPPRFRRRRDPRRRLRRGRGCGRLGAGGAGDPFADLAMMCTRRLPAFDLVIGTQAAWTSSRLSAAAGLAAKYEAKSPLPIVDLDAHIALACFKIGVIAAGIDHRHRAPGAGDDGSATAGSAVRPVRRRSCPRLRAELRRYGGALRPRHRELFFHSGTGVRSWSQTNAAKPVCSRCEMRPGARGSR